MKTMGDVIISYNLAERTAARFGSVVRMKRWSDDFGGPHQRCSGKRLGNFQGPLDHPDSPLDMNADSQKKHVTE